MSATPVRIHEGEDLADCFLEHVGGQTADTPRLSDAPVEALDLIREDRSLDAHPVWEQHFKGITLHVRGDGAAESQAHTTVVGARRDDHRRAMSRMLMDEIPTRRYIGRHYQASRPTALPVETSPC